MEKADRDNIRSCNCYRASSLTKPILDTNLISDFTDRYVVGSQLGWGKFGIIRACTDKLTGEVLACKSIAKERLVTEDDVRSVKLEIEIMTKLSGHPNVVDLKAVYEMEDYVHILMELCAGGELFHQIAKHGRFSESEARILFRQLMEVVTYCHENGIIHRDLKPENILLVSKSSLSPIKLADFGLATYIRDGQKLHVTVGSPFYIAPEVLAGGYDQAADVWSAGVILYILLSGMPPFWGKTKSEIFDAVRAAKLQFHPMPWDHITEAAKNLITEMLCFDPAERLKATDVLAHPWMNDSKEERGESNIQGSSNSEFLGVDNCSFSTSSILGNQDSSFAEKSMSLEFIQGENSLSNGCAASFSSFSMHNPPSSVLGGFSFETCNDATNFSTQLASMPSFTFLSPSPVPDSTDEMSFSAGASVTIEGYGIGRLCFSPDSSQPIEKKWNRRTEFRKGVANGTKVSSISSKTRNHTIGLGELDKLEIMAEESVIRWASCTYLTTSTSLRSSLVC